MYFLWTKISWRNKSDSPAFVDSYSVKIAPSGLLTFSNETMIHHFRVVNSIVTSPWLRLEILHSLGY
jgi:hypothetical protein